jgi:polysaccharide export outer membrane protein
MQRRSHEQRSFLSSFRFYLFTFSLIICFVTSVTAQGTAPNSRLQPSSEGARPRITTGLSSAVMAKSAGVTASHSNSEDEEYRIGPGDLLDIRVFEQPNLSSVARVSSQGTIRLPFVGDIMAACLTESDLAQAVAGKYKRLLNNPQVDVFIKEYQSQPVAVIGAVDKPARFQLQRRVRLLELLTFAGGPTKDAGYTVQVIHSGYRDLCATEQDGASTAGELSFSTYKLSELLSGSAASNIYVSPGDVVSVPEAEEIFVTGMVVKPGPVKMAAGTTLSQAIAMAGGLMPEAGKKVRLLRKKSGSSIVEEKVYNLEEIQKKKVEDIALEASDVVDVTTSTGKSVAQSLLRQIAPTLGLFPYVLGRR